MGQRRILVIGSQCDRLKPNLSFLPELAEELYRVMTDEARGECVPALPGSGLVLNRGAAETRTAIGTAFELASRDQATLLLRIHRSRRYFAEGE
jgi:hypothetical protein